MKKIRGILCIAVGLVLVVCGTVLFAKYDRIASEAGQSAQKLLHDLVSEVYVNRPAPVAPETSGNSETPNKQMVQTTLNGYDLIGILSVEEAGLELPILASWDYDLLQIAPCRYSGSIYNGNLILLAHNYDEHFGKLDLLEAGDRVVFLDIEGIEHAFSVVSTEILEPTQIEKLSSSPYPLTLFTCTPGGYSRLVVYCEMNFS